MKSTRAIFLVFAVLCVPLARTGGAQTNVTGVVVDEKGQPIPGVRCAISGFPRPSGGYTIYNGDYPYGYRYAFSDKEGHFSLPLPPQEQLADLQFDEEGGHFEVTNSVATRVPPRKHAPAFLSKVDPADGPVTVVMTEGKLLRGRIVERVEDQVVPIPHTIVELQMPHSDIRYRCAKPTGANGEFDFRISEPPSKRTWMLYYAGKRLAVNYDEIAPETLIVLEVSFKLTMSAEPGGAADGSQPSGSETNRTRGAAGSRR